jgi:N-acetylglutamate synthase-like GNAT family acetyltransferase
MKYGERSFAHAKLRLCAPTSLPVHMRGSIVEVRSLRVPTAHRREGMANQLILNLTAEADINKAFLFLAVEPAGDGGPDRAELASFYDRHGFIAIQAEPLLMVRPCVGVRGAGRA